MSTIFIFCYLNYEHPLLFECIDYTLKNNDNINIFEILIWLGYVFLLEKKSSIYLWLKFLAQF